jgi:hypothetical protein
LGTTARDGGEASTMKVKLNGRLVILLASVAVTV